MARPLRLEHAGALTARGDRREDIFFENEDRSEFLSILGEVCGRFNWVVHAYCQMTNHYHLLVETVDGNLWRGMRQLNGVYTQRFNRRRGLVGHLFQGRYKAILVQKDTYLLELTRYVVLNPVRARMVADPAEWPWSSYRTVVGEAPAPRWLDTDWLLGQFGGERMPAIGAYRQFVLAGKGAPSPLNQVQHQMLLGDDAFVVLHQQSRGRRYSAGSLQGPTEVGGAEPSGLPGALTRSGGGHGAGLFLGGLYHGRDRRAFRRSLHDGEPRCKSF
jgi:putative transposase